MEEKKSPWESVFFRLGLTYLLFLALSYICYLAVQVASIAISTIDIRILKAVNLGAQVMCLQTALYAFSYNNPIAHNHFMDLKIKEFSFFGECKRQLKSFTFWCEYVLLGLLLFILPEPISLLSFSFVLFGENLPATGLIRLTKLGIVVFVLFFELLLSKTNSAKNWLMHLNPSDIRKLASPAHLVLTVFVYIIGYFAACAVIPLLYPVVSTIPQLLKTTKILQVILIVVGVIIVFEILSLSRPLKYRSKFMKRLKKKAKELGFQITEKKHVYLSAIFVKCPGYITLEIYDQKEKKYKAFRCKLIAIKKARQSLVFRDDGQAFIIRPFFRSESLAITTFFGYDFETSAQKILLVTNNPYKMAVEENGSQREISTGEMLGDYGIYYPDNFFGVLERGLVAKKHRFED